ncbi:bilirubin oxidase [Massarina eburnea CBS 473.64]|uniref:Bilirubin oxidase n=1 Tax=Massarina eburnea CBS 473.64 TaxID=1395130 RepID=A0A6A6S7W4_9PLEO|nr:bilirubin oxidase [Massarina eburnea CBS 473.64]
MFLAQLSKLAFASVLFTHTHALRPTITANSNIQSPTGTSGFNSLRPSPTGQWISPKYSSFFEYPLPIPPQKTKTYTWTDDSTGASIDYYEVELKTFEQQIFPNLPPTELEGYDGMSPGPYFLMQQGREAVVRFTNDGPSNMSVHVHGQYNRAPFDGWAADYAYPGQYKDYYYPNTQNARTIWYHDHTEHETAENAYRGQEGGYIITDPQEQALNLPKGNYDVMLAIAAKAYNADGSLKWDTNSGAGLWGDIIQVNGQPWPYLNVEPRKYRFRLLDGSISRTFSFTFHEGLDGDEAEFQVIASDGGLFSHPVTTNNIEMAEGERYEIIFDFSNYAGKNITMRNQRGIGDMVDYAATDMVMRFVVGESVSDSTNNGDVPQDLRDIPAAPTSAPVKDFAFERVNDEWVINGVGFDDIEHRILTRPIRGEDEIWTLRNAATDSSHPVHIHLVDFQILSRIGGRGKVLPYESAGMKDVVWLAPGETVNVVARYAPWPGVYMFHCHNLVHEDHDMLVAFNVTNLAKWGYTNDTLFIDPMEEEFRPKPYNAADYTEDAIMKKIAWFYSTNAYNHGNIAGVYSAIDDGGQAQSTGPSVVVSSVGVNATTTPIYNGTTRFITSTIKPVPVSSQAAQRAPKL